MKKKTLVALLLVVCMILSFTLTGCNSSDKEEAAKPADKNLVFITKNLTNPIWLQAQKGAETAAAENGYTITTLAPTKADNQEEQTNIILDQLNKNIQGMLLIIVDDQGVIPAIEKVNEAGVPLVVAASRPKGGEFVWVGQDNTKAGEVAATTLIEKLGGKGNVVILDGTPGVQAAEQLHKGSMSVFESNPDIKVLTSISAKFMRAEGMTIMEDLLQKYPDINGVFAANDEMALGALEAITAAGKQDQIVVVGSDANIDAVKSISEGKLAATTDKRWYDLGYQGVTNLIKSIDGEKVEDTILEPVRVDSTNIDKYLELYDLK